MKRVEADYQTLRKIRCIADYQFFPGIGNKLFPEEVTISHSPKTGKIRFIYLSEELISTIRANDGKIALHLKGAEIILQNTKKPKLRVIILKDIVPFIIQGRSLFAKHIVEADPNIRPGDEVIVVDPDDNLIAVGKAILSEKEMRTFQTGVAVKIRISKNTN
ncbi:MAG: PUA domain-containing protein [Candidatus Jordarchaeaceae archaeon]